MPAVIRPARAADIDALIALESASFASDRLSRRAFRRLIERPSAVTLIAEEAGCPAGYCMVLVRRGSSLARLYSLAAVLRGLGRGLLAAAEQAARGHGCTRLRLEVRADNDRALGLYLQNGFCRIGARPGYYRDGTPALVLEKRLDGSARTNTHGPALTAMPS